MHFILINFSSPSIIDTLLISINISFSFHYFIICIVHCAPFFFFLCLYQISEYVECVSCVFYMLIKVKHRAFKWYDTLDAFLNDEVMKWWNDGECKMTKTTPKIWLHRMLNAVLCEQLRSLSFWKYVNNISQFEMLDEPNHCKPFIYEWYLLA